MPEWKQEILRRLANLKLDPAREVIIVEEMEQHLADYYADMLSGRATEAEAYRQSLDELESSDMLWRCWLPAPSYEGRPARCTQV